jgi:hypothetical protein
MTRAEAVRKLKKLFTGKVPYWWVGDEISGEEKRQKVRERLKEIEDIRASLDDRLNKLLLAQPWYVEMTNQKRDLWMERRKIEGGAHYKRFQIGYYVGGFVHIQGSGDTWEEAFAEYDRRKAKVPKG